MKKEKTINLPFVETVKRSFMYTLCNWELFLKVASVGLILAVFEMFSGFPILCSFGQDGCPGGWVQPVSSLLVLLISVGIIVNYSRMIILKSALDYRSRGFFRRVLLYILISFILSFAIAIPFIIFTLGWGMLLGAIGVDGGALTYVVLFVALVAWVIFLSPVFLIFPAITVDDKSITVKEAYRLAKGNYSKIFWGQFVLMLPCAVVVYLLAFLYQSMGVESYIVKFIFMIMLLGLSFLDSCFKASFFAHIYQYFTFYKGKSE